MTRVLPALLAILTLGILDSGCATLSQVTALHQVHFQLDRVSDGTLAGVPLDGRRSYTDLTPIEIAHLASAVANRNVPLTMAVHVTGENPASNPVTARLVQFDWTLLVKDKETVSGSLRQEFQFPPGQPTDVPIEVQLDLWKFFGGNARDLFDLAQSAAGIGDPTSIALRATPTIQTSLGPIRYPEPITIVHEQVGAR